MLSLNGKGFFIWKVRACEGGNPAAIAAIAAAAGLTHVLVKIADGPNLDNLDPTNNRDLLPPLVEALHQRGIAVWGWHYIYGREPKAEAQLAAGRTRDLGLDGYVINAEIEFRTAGMEVPAGRFMAELRRGLPSTPVALSSFRFPSIHNIFPWKEFLESSDYNMPQVYWLLSHDAGSQLRRSLREFQAITPWRPLIPTGATFMYQGWWPTADEVSDFLTTARTLNLPAANFYSWEGCRNSSEIRPCWDQVSSCAWPAPQTVQADIVERYIAALNSHDPAAVSALYQPDAVHITAARTSQGIFGLETWYRELFISLLPGATFSLTGTSGDDFGRIFSWQASFPQGVVRNGNDTFGLVDGKIAYHYSYFSVDKS